MTLFERNQLRIALHDVDRRRQAKQRGRATTPSKRQHRSREKLLQRHRPHLDRVSHTNPFTTLGSWVVVKFLVFVAELAAETIHAIFGQAHKKRRRRLTTHRVKW